MITNEKEYPLIQLYGCCAFPAYYLKVSNYIGFPVVLKISSFLLNSEIVLIIIASNSHFFPKKGKE